MAAAKTPTPADVLKLGQQVATIKASLPPKQWAKFVKLAHSRGHTIGGELSTAPSALKEKTAASIKDQAAKTVAAAYAPATAALTTREAAISNLDAKRKSDDASYNLWLSGETDKLNAQAQAADTAIATQQQSIADTTKTAIAAARADSLARVGAQAGTVSDPTQSTALDTSAADTAETSKIAAAQTQTAGLAGVGANSAVLAKASLLAQQAAREATRQGDTWKAIGDVAADRNTLTGSQAKDTLAETDSLTTANATNVSATRDSDLAAASLGEKQDDLAQQITAANQKYKLDTAKYTLDQWKAKNAATVAQAKVDLGYAGISSREGIAAANRALNEKLAKIKAKGTAKKPTITTQERGIYDSIKKAQSLYDRWDKNNAVPVAQRAQKLRDMNFDEGVIEVAHAIAVNGGVMPQAARVKARKLGLVHSGYFYPPTATDVNSTISTPELGQSGHS